MIKLHSKTETALVRYDYRIKMDGFNYLVHEYVDADGNRVDMTYLVDYGFAQTNDVSDSVIEKLCTFIDKI